MLAIEVGPADIAHTRYAISPLGEAMNALRVAAGKLPAGPLRHWVQRIAPRYEQLLRETPAVGALTALFRRGAYNADFIHPPPSGLGGDFATELAAVRATPPGQVRAEIARNLAGMRTPPHHIEQIIAAPDVLTRLADAIEATWHTLVQPDWPRLRTVLERDLVHRAGHLAMYGWASALSDLDPRMCWRSEETDGVIEIRTGARNQCERHHLGGKGLLLVPTVFGTLINYVEPPWPYALVYPARGVANLLAPPPPQGGAAALARLIGPHRAQVLHALAAPATTNQLAGQLGLSLGAVGGHLAVLRESGLVTRTRTGRSVRYERTVLAENLAGD